MREAEKVYNYQKLIKNLPLKGLRRGEHRPCCAPLSTSPRWGEGVGSIEK
jgi:hypothetical protein